MGGYCPPVSVVVHLNECLLLCVSLSNSQNHPTPPSNRLRERERERERGGGDDKLMGNVMNMSVGEKDD